MAPQVTLAAQHDVVLGVEPDAVTRALISLYLEPHGYEVRLASHVRDALASLSAPGVLLFVCSETALEAVSAAERERLREALGTLPVVTLLEPGLPPVLTRGWAGVCEHLTKPVRGDALLVVLQGTTSRRVAPPPGRDRAVEAGAGLLDGFEALIVEMEMDEAMVHDLVASFLERAPVYVKTMEEGLQAGELEQVDRAAHTMKGMCGNLRFGALVEASDRVRAAARGGDAASAAQGLAPLRGALDAVCEALRAR